MTLNVTSLPKFPGAEPAGQALASARILRRQETCRRGIWRSLEGGLVPPGTASGSYTQCCNSEIESWL